MSLWMPGAIIRPGPTWKVGYTYPGEFSPKRGDVKHSAEGGWAGIHAVLDGPRFSSWQFTVGYDHFEQHYPFNANCWHCGDVDDDGGVSGNIDFLGIEHLGMASQLLTAYQIQTTASITDWCSDQEQRDHISRFDGWDPDDGFTWLLAEHHEISDVFTECPSDRIPWDLIYAELVAGGGMHNIITVEGKYYYLTDGIVRVYIPDFDLVKDLKDAGLIDEGKWITISEALMGTIKDLGTMGGNVQPGQHSHKGVVEVK